MKALSIKEISFVNFKNYAVGQFQLGEKFNLVYGLNGTGKTNLLDGIYYICVGKSYFTPFDQKSVTYGESFFRIESKIQRGDSLHDIVVKVKPGFSKELLLDGTPLDKISTHLGFVPVVISAPKDIDLVHGSSQSRRRYIDHLLCQLDPDYLKALVLYNHLLQMRTATLKQDFKDLRRMIQAFDHQMEQPAQLIFNKREWLVKEILPRLQSNYTTLADNRENVSIAYDSQLKNLNYDLLVDKSWETDKITQRSNSGIHKDDFDLFVKGMPAKEYASQGQVKSLIFALHLSKSNILSQQKGYKPILIFDDIFDKLDEKRLANLMDILQQPEFGQIFLSDTNRKRVGEFVRNEILHEIEMTH